MRSLSVTILLHQAFGKYQNEKKENVLPDRGYRCTGSCVRTRNWNAVTRRTHEHRAGSAVPDDAGGVFLFSPCANGKRSHVGTKEDAAFRLFLKAIAPNFLGLYHFDLFSLKGVGVMKQS